MNVLEIPLEISPFKFEGYITFDVIPHVILCMYVSEDLDWQLACLFN